MASKTEICNLALAHLGVGKEIANVETERSQEATACRRFYDTARDATLRDFNWPFASRIVSGELIEEEPNDEWNYSYRVPVSALRIRRIISGTRNDTRQARVPYKIAQDAEGQLYYTDQESAEIEITYREDNPAMFPPDFVLALSFRIAMYVASIVTGGDPFKLGDKARQMYAAEISRAAATSVNEEQADEEPDSEFIRVRE